MLLLVTNIIREQIHSICSLIFLVPILFFGQDNCLYSFEAQVFDLHENTPLVDARVELLGSTKITSTTEKGVFVFSRLCPGTYSVLVSHPLCDAQEYNIQIPQKKEQIFKLEHHVNELAEVVLEDNLRYKTKRSVVESELDEQALQRNQGADLATLLSGISGISTLKTGTSISKPIIHGMSGSRVGIVIDGVRLQDQEWGADHAPTLDVNTADRISVVKGAGVLRYGGDTPGGIIILKRNRMIFQDSIQTRVGTNFQSNGRGGGLFAKTNWSNSLGTHAQINVSVNRLGDMEAPDYILSNTGSDENAFSVAFGRHKIQSGWEASYRYYDTKVGILRAAHVGNSGDLARAIDSPEPLIINPFTYTLGVPRQESQHHNGKLSYFKRFNEQSKWELNYNVQWNHRQEFDVRRGDLKSIPAIDLQLWTHDAELFLTTKFADDFNVSTGISAKFQDNYSDPRTGVKRLIPDYKKQQWALFSALEYVPNNSWNVDIGFRVENSQYNALKFYDERDWLERGYADTFSEAPITDYGTQLLATLELPFQTLSTSMGVGYTLSSNHNLLFNFNHSQRAPNPSELFSDGLHHALATIEYGNLRLSKETVNKGLLGLEGKFQKGFYKTSFYYSDLKNYIVIEPEGFEQTVRGAFPVWQYRATNGYMAGVDVDFGYPFSVAWKYSFTGSLIHAYDSLAEQPLIDVPPFNLQQQISWKYPKAPNFEISLQHSFSAFQTRFPDTNFNYNELIDGNLVATPIDISTPPDAYHLWELSLAYTLTTKTKKYWDFRIIVENMTNTSYREYLNRLRFYADEMGRNVRLQLNYNF